MSDAKPFAECVSIGDDNHIKIGGIVFPSRYTKDSISQDAEYINAAVARARREAAEEALSQLAADVRAAAGPTLIGKPSDPFWREHFAGLAEMRAAALRMDPS